MSARKCFTYGWTNKDVGTNADIPKSVLVSSPPAPEAGSSRVHNDVSPILAQTFTEAFTVFSAKRFPGVPGEGQVSLL